MVETYLQPFISYVKFKKRFEIIENVNSNGKQGKRKQQVNQQMSKGHKKYFPK